MVQVFSLSFPGKRPIMYRWAFAPMLLPMMDKMRSLYRTLYSTLKGLVTRRGWPKEALLLLYPADVLLADGVPGGHVFLHARADAGLFAAGHGGAGLGDAVLETVLVDFLTGNKLLFYQ
jgi:hypothetical protein